MGSHPPPMPTRFPGYAWFLTVRGRPRAAFIFSGSWEEKAAGRNAGMHASPRRREGGAAGPGGSGACSSSPFLPSHCRQRSDAGRSRRRPRFKLGAGNLWGFAPPAAAPAIKAGNGGPQKLGRAAPKNPGTVGPKNREWWPPKTQERQAPKPRNGSPKNLGTAVPKNREWWPQKPRNSGPKNQE